MVEAKSTAKATSVTRARRPARRKATSLEFGSRHYRCKATVGSLDLIGPDGQVWQPAACGEHRSVPVNETATDDAGPAAKGFQADCEACRTQAIATAAHALQHSTV